MIGSYGATYCVIIIYVLYKVKMLEYFMMHSSPYTVYTAEYPGFLQLDSLMLFYKHNDSKY